MLNNDNNANAKNKKTSTNTKKDEKNILLEYMGKVDDKLLKKYSNGKNVNSFIDEFDRATNEENKEKVVKELETFCWALCSTGWWGDDYSEYKCKLFDIINAVDYFLYEHSKKWASDFNWGKHSKAIKHFM